MDDLEVLSSPSVIVGRATALPRGIIKMAATLRGSSGGSGTSVSGGNVRGVTSLRGIGAAGPRGGTRGRTAALGDARGKAATLGNTRGRAAAFGNPTEMASHRGTGTTGPRSVATGKGDDRDDDYRGSQASEEEDLLPSPRKR